MKVAVIKPVKISGRCACLAGFIVVIVFPLVVWGSLPVRADAQATVSNAIQGINTQVAAIEGLIQAGKLACLEIKYEYEKPTEGLPPSFRFFFNSKDGALQACHISVGHETWAKVFSYYFDSSGEPLKYRETISGREDKPEPTAIIYGGKGKIIWKNMTDPRVPPEDIKRLFSTLQTRAAAFSGY